MFVTNGAILIFRPVKVETVFSICKGFDDPSRSERHGSLEAAKPAGHHEQDCGRRKPRRADHGRFQVSITSFVFAHECFSCFDKNGSGALARSDMELVLSVQFPLRYYESSTMLSFFFQ